MLEIHTGVAVNATGVGKKYFIKDHKVNNSFPLLTGGGSIDSSYCVPKWTKYLCYDKEKENILNNEFDKEYYKEKGSHQRPFNLRKKEEYDRPKILLRQSDVKLTATYSEDLIFGNYSLFNLYHSNDDKKLLKYLLALLNSRLLTYYCVKKEIILIKPGKTPQIRSGQRGPIGIRQIPIIQCNLTSMKSFISFVEILLFLKKCNKNLLNIVFFERLLNAMVYELYLPEVIQSASCEVLKHITDLPELEEGWSDEKKLKTIEKAYIELSDPSHPVSVAMFKMDTIEEIRNIEGKQ
jgi:hypothetical protein